jgi:hypothetical protein
MTVTWDAGALLIHVPSPDLEKLHAVSPDRQAVFALARSKTGFGQVKIMKEFVWINRHFFSKFGFRASRWKKLRQRLNRGVVRIVVSFLNYFKVCWPVLFKIEI